MQSFKTPHDAIGSVGFRLECKGESLAYVTDLGYMPDKIMKIIEGSDVVLLEANHDVDMLRSGAYPPFLQHRIHSDEGHLSNDAAALCALELVKCGTKLIVLAHLSDKNNTPDIALKTVRTMLEKAGYYCELEVAPRSSDGKIYEVALCDILN